ncbi:MAG: hypoxanthine-guanine phosphoribosyltransferase [endosymbiont of Galathealinum brachiosum]|uniref:Hypoxanthine-guanine phosphoribosyltransferase n=1 Tax=endosymbiont of Galathealinum brachiosum TaxID=2200906 RepID=A0A370DI08_9GAMM|nr:MAG: hypoxanthine-guanine phosphoribosyltransferase [endosymbiont of Galathealinum brachiosum]
MNQWMTVSLHLRIDMKNYGKAKQILESAELIYTADQIQQSIDELAQKINTSLINTPQPVIVLPIMNGGLILSGQLITRLNFPVELDYLHATRYRDKTTGSDLQWKVKPQLELKNRTLLVIDDIFDEGHTLQAVVEFCKSENADHVYSAVLVEKNHPRPKSLIKSDFIGMRVEDRYVFGFGMDYKGYHRNLNAIYAVSNDEK